MTDSEILDLYSQWSEDCFCAGFLNPSPETVKEFRTWLENPDEKNWHRCIPYFDYEQEMLNEFHEQESKVYNAKLNCKELEDYI